MSKRVLAVILGGGAGTRLYPLTQKRSKPAVPIAGKYRLIDIPISNCLNSGIKRMFVLTQYNSASLNKHIKNTYHFDHFGAGFVDILAAEQTAQSNDWFQGTADAVRKSLIHFVGGDFDYFLILSGDQLYQMDFKKMIDSHMEKDAQISIATIPVGAKDATSFGIMKVNEGGMIDNFIEKPDAELLPQWTSAVSPEMAEKNRHYLASMGIYLFNRDVLLNLLETYPHATDFGKEIIPSSITTNHRVASYAFQGYWTDIGNISSFFEANLELTDRIPQFNMFNRKMQIYTRPRMLPPAKIQGTTIKSSLIAEACFIHAKSIDNCIIGLRSRIGNNVELKDCVLMGHDYVEQIEDLMVKDRIPMGIGDNCVISRAIIDKNSRIGSNVVIRGNAKMEDVDTENYSVRDGIVIIKKSAVIPSGFVLE